MLKHALFRALTSLLAGALLFVVGIAKAQQAQAPVTQPAAAAATTPTVAVLQGLDKTTARVSTFDAPVDQSVKFGTLVITVRACSKRPPEEPPETTAFLQIDELRSQGSSVTAQRIFSGWMFASSPALSALEHPVYDVSVLDCKTASGSSAKSTGK